MRRRAAICAAVAVVLPSAAALGGCGAADPGGTSPRTLPAGVTSTDGRTLYAASIDAGAARTTVEVVDRAARRTLRTRAFPGLWVIPPIVPGDRSGTLSGDGRTIALAGPSGEGTSSFALIDTRLARLPRTFTLRGRWSFDALSPDGRIVYVIEHGRAGHYQVRAYDAEAGRLRAQPIVEKGERDPDMTGVPADREIAGGGSPVFTLYRRGARGAFVHALHTREGVALCVDLPAGGEWRLEWRGPRLLAVDRVSGRRVAADGA